MPTITCPACGRAIADAASACPGCGRSLAVRATAARRRWIIGLVALAVTLVVLAILLLAGEGARTRAGVASAAHDADVDVAALTVRTISNQLELLRVRAPDRAYPASLDVLVERGQIVASQTRDPWDTPLGYTSDGRRFTLCSHGADRAAGGGDDICVRGP